MLLTLRSCPLRNSLNKIYYWVMLNWQVIKKKSRLMNKLTTILLLKEHKTNTLPSAFTSRSKRILKCCQRWQCKAEKALSRRLRRNLCFVSISSSVWSRKESTRLSESHRKRSTQSFQALINPIDDNLNLVCGAYRIIGTVAEFKSSVLGPVRFLISL